MSATVTCQVRLSDLALPGLPGTHPVEGRGVSVLDTLPGALVITAVRGEDRGAAALVSVIAAVALFASVGLVVDYSGSLRARQRADASAEEAARAAGADARQRHRARRRPSARPWQGHHGGAAVSGRRRRRRQ